MKNLNVLMLGALLLGGLLVASCNKDNDDNGGGVGGKLPISVTEDQGDRAYRNEYTYDGKNRLLTSAYRYLDTLGNVLPDYGADYVYTYDGERLVEIVGTLHRDGVTYTRMISYGANSVTVIAKYSDNNLADTSWYELNAEGQVLKDGGSHYTYASDGTLTKNEWFNNGAVTPEDVSIYTYDDKNGIYKNWNMPSWFTTDESEYRNNMVHNAVSRNVTSTYQGGYSYTSTYVIEYDADSYPVKITETETRDGKAKLESVITIVYK